MAASMVRKGINVLGLLSGHDLERLRHVLPSMHRRYKKTKAAPSSRKDVYKPPAPKTPVKKFLQEKPTQSIYFADDYPPQPFMFSQCVNMHQEAAHPNMTNTMYSQIYADLKLDLTTKKKTKFLKGFRGLLEFPNTFEHGQKKVFYVFSEDQEHVDIAKEMGALYAGGEDIMNYFKENLIRKEDIENCDFIFSTPNMAVKLLSYRMLLADRLPSIHNGCVSTDIEELILKYEAGVRYKSHRESDAVARMQVPFGQLNQKLEELDENFKYMIDVLSTLKPKQLEPLVTSVSVVAPPSDEVFLLNKEEFAPVKEEVKSDDKDENLSDSDDDD